MRAERCIRQVLKSIKCVEKSGAIELAAGADTVGPYSGDSKDVPGSSAEVE